MQVNVLRSIQEIGWGVLLSTPNRTVTVTATQCHNRELVIVRVDESTFVDIPQFLFHMGSLRLSLFWVLCSWTPLFAKRAIILLWAWFHWRIYKHTGKQWKNLRCSWVNQPKLERTSVADECIKFYQETVWGPAGSFWVIWGWFNKEGDIKIKRMKKSGNSKSSPDDPASINKCLKNVPKSNWNLEMLVFMERGKPETLEKHRRNQQQTQPTYGVNTRSQTQATLIRGEFLTTAPSLLP